MRLRPMDEEVRVYMAPYEYETYLDHCDRRERLASRIIAESSPRIGKTANWSGMTSSFLTTHAWSWRS